MELKRKVEITRLMSCLTEYIGNLSLVSCTTNQNLETARFTWKRQAVSAVIQIINSIETLWLPYFCFIKWIANKKYPSIYDFPKHICDYLVREIMSAYAIYHQHFWNIFLKRHLTNKNYYIFNTSAKSGNILKPPNSTAHFLCLEKCIKIISHSGTPAAMS